MLKRDEEIRQLARASRPDSFNLALKFNTLNVGAYLFFVFLSLAIRQLAFPHLRFAHLSSQHCYIQI